jgi:hypothetical protein
MKIIIILEKCPYWRDVHIKEVYLLNFLYIARAVRIVLSIAVCFDKVSGCWEGAV